MSVELRPLGVSCNIGCRYCYQNPIRKAGNLREKYDLEKMKAAVTRAGRAFTLFGGEPLLMNLRDLEHLLAWGHEQYGSSQLQTNGSLVSEAHLRLFRRYRVRLGISIDGPDELNDARWAHTAARTRATTRRVERLIARGRSGTAARVDRHPASRQRHRRPPAADERVVPPSGPARDPLGTAASARGG